MAANLNVGFSGDLNGNLGDHGEELGDLDSSHRSKDVEKKRDSEKGCQMAIVRFLDGMCLSLLPSVLWLCYSALQNLIPSFPWIAPPCPPPWHNPRKGRDQILPSGNIVLRVTCGMGGMGCYLVAFVLITECTTPR